MITTKKLEQLLEMGLDMNHYFVIHCLQNGESLPQHQKITSSLLTLERKQLVVLAGGQYHLTSEGQKLYEEEGKSVKPKVPSSVMNIQDLQAKLRDKLKSIKGKTQVAGFGNVYFIPSTKDLEDFLARFRRKYPQLWDERKIEKCLLQHVEKCAKADKFSPAVKYFIIKEGTGSQLAAALESFEEGEDVETQHKIIDTKDLFE